jgi:hypothetical protein
MEESMAGWQTYRLIFGSLAVQCYSAVDVRTVTLSGNAEAHGSPIIVIKFSVGGEAWEETAWRELGRIQKGAFGRV